MRSIIQPVLTFVRWVICHTDSGRKFTRFYKEACDKRRRHKACMRLQRYGWEILSRVRMALDKTDAGYFVDYGTLLGLVRDGGFIKHDDDVDFSLPYGKLSPQELLNIMLQYGFTFKRAFLWRGQITEITFLWKKIEVDFFYILSEIGVGRYSLMYDFFAVVNNEHVAQKVTRLEKPDCLATKVMKINGVDVITPVATPEFLEYSYGTGWRMPVKNFNSDGMAHRTRFDDSARMFVTLDDFKQYFSTLP